MQPYPGRPPRRKRTVILISAIAAVVVVAAAGVGGYLLLGGDGSSPEQVAQDTAKAVTDGDVAALRDLACDAGTINKDDVTPSDGVKLKVEIAGDPKVNGSKAEVPINLKVDYSKNPDRAEAGLPPSTTLKGSLKLNDGDDGWCADMTKPIGPGRSG